MERKIKVTENKYKQAIRDRERLLKLKKLQQKQNNILEQLKSDNKPTNKQL